MAAVKAATAVYDTVEKRTTTAIDYHSTTIKNGQAWIHIKNHVYYCNYDLSKPLTVPETKAIKAKLKTQRRQPKQAKG